MLGEGVFFKEILRYKQLRDLLCIKAFLKIKINVISIVYGKYVSLEYVLNLSR